MGFSHQTRQGPVTRHMNLQFINQNPATNADLAR